MVFGLNHYSAEKSKLAPAVTQIQYVFETTGPVREVTFLTTSSDNPNNEELKNDLIAGGRNDMLRSDVKTPELGFAAAMPDDIAVDVWCKVEPLPGQFSILKVTCFQPGHNDYGIAVHGEYDPSRMMEGSRQTIRYLELDSYVNKLRTDLRNILVLTANQ
jgi:hypothetical protein